MRADVGVLQLGQLPQQLLLPRRQGLGDFDVRLYQQVADARRELAALDAGALDPAELERALAEFEPLWAELSTPEKARALALLLERVTFDAESGEVEIRFRPGGPRLLEARTADPRGAGR